MVLAVILTVSVLANIYLVVEMRSRAEASARAEAFALYFAGSRLETAAKHLERAAEVESEQDFNMEIMMADHGIFVANQFMQVLRLDMPDEEMYFISDLFEAMFRALRDLMERNDQQIRENLLHTARDTGKVVRDISSEMRDEGSSGGAARSLYTKMTTQIEESLRAGDAWHMLVDYVPYLEDVRR
ncbi:MAG: hypothetical protein R6U70_03850 [Bacillota bacterium]